MANNKCTWNIDDGRNELMKVWKARTDAKLREAMAYVASYTAGKMKEQKHGEIYTKDGITWQASAGIGKPGGPSAYGATDGEYPAIFKENLIKEMTNPDNIRVYWKGKSATALVQVDQGFVREYALGVLEKGLRPWRNRAMMECAPKLEIILGEKLIMEVNEGISQTRQRTRWD